MMDCETAILLRMHQKGLVGGKYRSIQNVRRSIGWGKIASHYHEKRKFDAIARRLLKKKMLDDAGKSASVLSLSAVGQELVKMYLEKNPGAGEELDAAMRGDRGE